VAPFSLACGAQYLLAPLQRRHCCSEQHPAIAGLAHIVAKYPSYDWEGMRALHGFEHVTIIVVCTTRSRKPEALYPIYFVEIDRIQYITFVIIIKEVFFDRVKYKIVIIIMETEQLWHTIVDQPLRG
jgi:hypothetical protein